MPPRRMPSAAGLAAALAVVALVTGCDAGPDASGVPDPVVTTTGAASPTAGATPSAAPAPTPEPTPTAAPTPEPTPASSARAAANLPVPEAPDLAGERSAEGLEAFTAHWLALLSYSYEANDLDPLLAVSDPACQFCAAAEESMAQLYRTAWASGGATTLTDFATDFTEGDDGTYTAEITTSQTEIFYFSVEGWLGSSESKPDTPHTVTARHVDGGWELVEYTSPPAG